MFKQIKELRQESTDTTKELTQLKCQMRSLQDQFRDEQERLEEIRGLQIDFINQFKQNLKALGFLQESIQRELTQFKALNSQVSRTLTEKLEKELAEVTQHATMTLTTESEKNQKLKEQVDQTAKHLIILNNNIGKLADIALGIKKTDFELSSFVDKIREEDRHKVELMQENERLKSIIAKMKQGPRRMVPKRF